MIDNVTQIAENDQRKNEYNLSEDFIEQLPKLTETSKNLQKTVMEQIRARIQVNIKFKCI